MIIQMRKKVSLFNNPQCFTKSALERNFTASASSRNPSTIFTEVSQEPDFGKEFSQLGKRANRVNGKASASPKPPIPMVNCQAPPLVDKDPASSEPKIGPVQENDTNASVRAMKKIPASPPRLDLLSALLASELGMVISKSPKKERANTTNMAKKNKFRYTLVEMVFRISGLLESRKWNGILSNR